MTGALLLAVGALFQLEGPMTAPTAAPVPGGMAGDAGGMETGLPPEIAATLRPQPVPSAAPLDAAAAGLAPGGAGGAAARGGTAAAQAGASPAGSATPSPTPTPSRIERLLGEVALQALAVTDSAGRETLASTPPPAQFGYDVFDGSAGRFAPIADQPAGPDYVVGPGDAFTLTLYGKINGSFPLAVGADGKVVLPRAGPVTVWGMTL